MGRMQKRKQKPKQQLLPCSDTGTSVSEGSTPLIDASSLLATHKKLQETKQEARIIPPQLLKDSSSAQSNDNVSEGITSINHICDICNTSTGSPLSHTLGTSSLHTVPSPECRDPMSSQRKRTDRGGARNNGGDSAEEVAIWSSAQDDIRKIVRLVNRAEEGRQEILDMEADFAKMAPLKPSVEQIDALSALQREQVKLSEEIIALGKGNENGAIQKLELLKALVAHKEQTAEPSRRGGSSRDGVGKTLGEVDTAAESPAPSPIVDKPLRKDRSGTGRGSLPPKETSVKGVEAAETPISAGVEINAKGKITFAMGAEVAFRPKATGGEEPEWIQGVVVKIIGEGKSRRYDVQDPEPDEVTKKPGQVYRTSASSMVAIPAAGQPLPDYPKGKQVLARYPDTTTFYRAEVIAMEGGKVKLRFEGEEDAQVHQEVDRRFVLDHRG